jgi:hypothetical protein
LSYRFFGPFRELAQVGAVAYRLDLLEEYHIHPLVHVSQLKRHMLATTLVEDGLIQILMLLQQLPVRSYSVPQGCCRKEHLRSFEFRWSGMDCLHFGQHGKKLMIYGDAIQTLQLGDKLDFKEGQMLGVKG